MAKQQGIRKLIVQMDNKACVEAMKNANQQHGECMHIINNCRSLCNVFVSFAFVNCYREGNRVADILANIGVGFQERVVYFDDPPVEIKNFLWEDLVGVALPRMVM
ncbi:uncharacterized protein LOC110716749 [Chenopodium quinoa]|uniref:uncharacterized protein LOC110716749 n=1 Tax=Chenopodium quinoa TaxID=63459 RepID=UPI000B77E220|nr:uncharacterized protein LOC110716749 [Chenopodium quinoa]